MQTRNSTRLALILVTVVGLILVSVGTVIATAAPAVGEHVQQALKGRREPGFRSHAHLPRFRDPEQHRSFRNILNRDSLLAATAAQLDIAATDLQDALQSAKEQLLAEAVDSGIITQSEADALASEDESARGFGQGRRGWHDDAPWAQALDKDSLIAEIAVRLGLTAADLQTAWANGDLPDLLAAQGIDAPTFKQAVQNATDQLLDQAVADGTLTQDEADWLQSRGRDAFRHRGQGWGFHLRPDRTQDADPNA